MRRRRGAPTPGKRYKVASEWHKAERIRVRDFYHEQEVFVITEIADARDTRGGHLYRGGCYRVRIEGKLDMPDKPRQKSFVGESAWSWAENYANDVEQAIRRYWDTQFTARPGAFNNDGTVNTDVVPEVNQ